MGKTALGFIETRGNTGSLLAIDAMLKAAHVEYVRQVNIGGSYVTAIVRGEVGAVRASVDAGKAAAQSVGELVCANVIPSAHERVAALIGTET